MKTCGNPAGVLCINTTAIIAKPLKICIWLLWLSVCPKIILFLFIFNDKLKPKKYLCRRRTRKRLVVSQRRYEGACNRIADANVTFCDKGAAADKVKPCFWYKNTASKKARRDVVVTPTGFEPMLPPWKGDVLTTWPRGHIWLPLLDLNQRPCG